ncbi:MAG: hypothetical protein HY707_07175 [Ignavibacteriae bacterium]|nr:hypothetical protein [Ignavibacteriota bacterium]
MTTQLWHKFQVGDRAYILFPSKQCPYLVGRIEKIRFDIDAEGKSNVYYFVDQDDESKHDLFKMIESHFGMEVMYGLSEKRLQPFNHVGKQALERHKRLMLRKETRNLQREQYRLVEKLA